MFGYSQTMEPLKNEAEFEARYSEMGPDDSDKFFQLRQEQLTGKYRLADTGLTLTMLALICLVACHFRSKLMTPSNKLLTLAVGFCAAGLTYFAEIITINLDNHRYSFPHWADAIGILISISNLWFLILIWV